MAYKILDERDINLSYNPESENAQSGKAVAEGLRTKADKNKILDYITYTIESDNTVTITDCDTSISGSHIIPSTIEGYPVTTIGMNAFKNCTGITSIIIPKGITSLYPSAFYGCSNLTSIEIPDTVNDMGYDVFSGCTKLKEVSFNAKITSLYGSTFANCTSLTSIVIPNGVIDIVTDFYNCSSLKTITIPDSVTSIYESAFYNCTSLTDVYYSGTQEQWNSIDIGNHNDSLLNATIYYNQELATKEFVLKNGGSGSGTVDQTYNPESENPQSGKAVAEAVKAAKNEMNPEFVIDSEMSSESSNAVMNKVAKKYIDDKIKTTTNKIDGLRDDFDGSLPWEIVNGGTGASDPENARKNLGAAPSGFGLGNAQLITIDQLDVTTKPGFYCISETMEFDGYSASYWYLTVSAYGSGNPQCTQVLEPVMNGDSYRLRRIIRTKDGTFPWEWENPPVKVENTVVPIEYRTVERWNNKPVYTCVVKIKLLADANLTTSDIIINSGSIDACIRYSARTNNYHLPYDMRDELNYRDFRITANANSFTVERGSNASKIEETLFVQIWYTKK